MIHVVIGHRGTGKTSLGKRIRFYHPEYLVLDLDEEIERRAQTSIENIFKQEGESQFRQLEQKYFFEILNELQETSQEAYVIVGAGFEVENIPATVSILLICRSSDAQGRIFFNRTRLHPEVPPLEEYFLRYESRQTKFLATHHFCYEVPEGLGEYFNEISNDPVKSESSTVLKVEQSILNQSFQSNFCYTLHPQDVSVPKRMEVLVEMVRRGNLKTLELRDDLLSRTQIFDLLRLLPNQKILLSLRRNDSADLAEQVAILPQVELWGIDCDEKFLSEKILLTDIHASLKIISSHDESIPSAQLPPGWIMKWSPLISSWQKLAAGLHWKLRNQSAIFLPRSEEGRWTWLRLLLSQRQALHFIQLSHASASDQPNLFESLLFEKVNSSKQIAGVMGSPVRHSFSPVFHADAFAAKQMPYFRFLVRETEWHDAMNFFNTFRDYFDLRMISVTSPLKKLAAQTSQHAPGLSACNTLTLFEGQNTFQGDNTDEAGFFEAFHEHLKGHVLLWGGGGMVESVERACEKAGVLSFTHLSSRLPDYKQFDFDREYTIVWAAPSSEQTQYPNKEIKIVKILDLNYFESSYGRHQALAKKNEYHSGYEMFVCQAQKQQEIWSLK